MSEITHPSNQNSVTLGNKGLSHLAKGGSISLFGLAAGKVFAFLTEVILARFLGVTSYGLLSLARSFIQVLNFSVDLGMRQGIIRFGTIYRTSSKHDYQKGLLLGSLKVTISVGLFFVITLFAYADLIAKLFNKPGLETLIRILSLGLIPTGISMIIASFARSQLNFGIDVLLRISLQQFLTLILSYLIVGWIRADVPTVAFTLLVAILINMVVGLTIAGWKFIKPMRLVQARYSIKKWLRFSIPTFVLDISYLLLRHASRLLLGYYGQVEYVGFFAVTTALAENLTFFLIAFNPILAPLIVTTHEDNDRKEFLRNYRLIGRWQLTLTLPVALIMLAFSREFMMLFGKDFLVSTNLLILLVLSQIITVAAGPSGMVLQMTGHQDIELVNGICALIINISLGLWLIPQLGVIGAGISTTIAVLVLQIARLSEIYVFLKVIPYDRTYLKCVLAASISLICIVFLKNVLFTVPSLTSFILGAILIFTIYFLSLVIFKIEDNDKKALKKIWSIFEEKWFQISRQ